MQTKLTIRISDKVIKRAKVYARRHQTSLSKLIENQLQEITAKEWKPKTLEELSPLVKAMMGSGKKDVDLDEAREEYLFKKYVK